MRLSCHARAYHGGDIIAGAIKLFVANLDDNMQIKQRIIENNGLVRSIYGSAENPDFTVFSVDHGTAYMFDFSGNPPESFVF